MKILVADDDRVSLMTMRRMLLRSGYEVLTASDGAAAVRTILEPGGPRLVLLDWMMPSLNGPEVCRAIRAGVQSGYIYIILLTAKDSKEDLVAGLEAGADDYLIKPCHPQELTARLRTGERILRLEDGLVEARDEMRFRATHDALTQVLNRGAIVHALSEHLDLLRGSHGAIAVLLCDVDHFKQINDSYGHPVGDEVLRAIARRLGDIALGTDAVGRFGGEEFLLVLRDISPEGMSALGRNICDTIYSSPVETSAGPISVSLSIGIVSVGGHEGTWDVDEVLKRADALLYDAKREGRNRAIVESSSEMVLPSTEAHFHACSPPALLSL